MSPTGAWNWKERLYAGGIYLWISLSIVGMIQSAALGHGVWTVSVVRPVHLLLEFDRFRVIHANKVPEGLLAQTPVGIRAMPWKGLELSARPDLWEPFAQARGRVLGAAKLLLELRQRLRQQTVLFDRVIGQTDVPDRGLRYQPMVGRNSYWAVLLNANTAEIGGFLPLDSL